MNRCKRALVIPFLSAIVGLTTLTVTFVPSDARAQMTARQFPPTARRGTLEVLTPPEILIDGKAERLSPGARIRGLNNMLVMSGQMVGVRVLVNYIRNPQGQIHDVWILNDLEAREERAGSGPVTNYIFGSDADRPKVDDGKTPFDQLPKYKQ